MFPDINICFICWKRNIKVSFGVFFANLTTLNFIFKEDERDNFIIFLVLVGRVY